MQDDSNTPTTKKCYKCKQNFDLTGFYRDRSRPDGLQAACKKCKLAMKKKWVEENQERVRSTYREWVNDNREVMREFDRRRYAADKDSILARQRRRREANKEAIAERRRIIRASKRDEVNRKQRRYYHENKGNQSWLVRARNRKDKVRANGGYISTADWQRVLARFEGKCAKCGSPDNIHMDHVVPLAKGGKHSVDNVQPLCATCNLRKHTKIEDYRGKMYQPLALPLDNDT